MDVRVGKLKVSTTARSSAAVKREVMMSVDFVVRDVSVDRTD